MAFKIYDVTSAAIEKNEEGHQVVLALFDNRYGSCMIIRPQAFLDTGPPCPLCGESKVNSLKLQHFDPDGAERLFWMDKFGMITDEDYQAELAALETDPKKKLYNMLKAEVEEDERKKEAGTQ